MSDQTPEEKGNPPPTNTQRVLLDTTIQLDRLKFPSRQKHIETVLSSFDMKFTTSLVLLEFKATIIEQCILIHNQMRRPGARFTQVRDQLLEKNHPQVKLRMHIFNNLIRVFASASAFDIDPKTDVRLAEKARLALENIIPDLYKWFREESVAAVLRDRVCCTRAEEAPEKLRVAFDTNLPRCKRGLNKNCHVEDVIRKEGSTLLDKLRPIASDSEQLLKSIDKFESVINDPQADVSWEYCRAAGDALIVLEGVKSVTHAASTNATEWRRLSEIAELEFVHITYPDEKTY